MLHWVIGKVVEEKSQVVSNTTGTFKGDTILGAGGAVYGGGSSGRISTTHENISRWVVFTNKEELVSISHPGDLPAATGDIVAVATDKKGNHVLVANLTDSKWMMYFKDWGDTVIKTIGVILLGVAVLAMGDRSGIFIPVWIWFAFYPLFAARRVINSKRLAKSAEIKLREIFEEYSQEMQLSREKRRKVFQNI